MIICKQTDAGHECGCCVIIRLLRPEGGIVMAFKDRGKGFKALRIILVLLVGTAVFLAVLKLLGLL